MLPIVLAVIATGVYLIYYLWTSVYNTWERRGISSFPGRFPYGSSKELSLNKRFPPHIIEEMYKEKSDEPYFGIYLIRTPWLIVRDPEIIQIVLAKNFSNFRDRSLHEPSKSDPLSHHLASLTGDKWRALRIKLTPTFTSGKLKGMFPIFVSASEGLTKMILSQMDKDLVITNFTSSFTIDVISSYAFGLEPNTTANPDHPFKKLPAFFGKNQWRAFVEDIVTKIFPQLQAYKRGVPLGVEKFLTKLIKDTTEYREKNGLHRNDFLDLLMQLRDKGTVGDDMKEDINEPFEMTLEMMTAQSFVFFFAGFATSSSVQTFCLYELALNQDIQRTLREEIDRVIEKHGELTYQAVQEMEYLHMVISETLRKYPTIPTMPRVCTKTFTMPGGHTIQRGDVIMIPVWSLHRDPNLFPEPENFNPERFSSKNGEKIKPFTYLPFGEGPRICIGNRFGLLQTKVGVLTVLRNFNVFPCDKTPVPLKMKNSGQISASKDPIVLKLVSRKDKI